MDKPKWTDLLSCMFAGFALLASVVFGIVSVVLAWQANTVAETSNRIAVSSNQLALEINQRNEAFGKYLVELEKHLEEQGKRPNIISLAGEIKPSNVRNCRILTAVLQNNGERDAVVLMIGFSPFDPNLIGAMPGSFNQTPSALKVDEVRRDLRSHNWATPYDEKGLFIIPAGKVISLKIAFPSSLGKGSFYLGYSDRQFVQIGQID